VSLGGALHQLVTEDVVLWLTGGEHALVSRRSFPARLFVGLARPMMW